MIQRTHEIAMHERVNCAHSTTARAVETRKCFQWTHGVMPRGVRVNRTDVRRGHDKANSDQTRSEESLGTRMHSYTLRRTTCFALS